MTYSDGVQTDKNQIDQIHDSRSNKDGAKAKTFYDPCFCKKKQNKRNEEKKYVPCNLKIDQVPP